MIRTSRLYPYAATSLTRSLIEHADRNHAKHPQYAGHFDTWVLRQVTEDTHFKGYSQFEAGEIVLCAPDVTIHEGIRPSLSTYCPRTGSVCAMPWEHTREVVITDL